MRIGLLNAINVYLDSGEAGAILIDGKWGAGKTYFVNNSLKETIANVKINQLNPEQKFRFAYCSLNGITNMGDFYSRLYEALLVSFPKDKASWKSTSIKAASKFIQQASKVPFFARFLPNSGNLLESLSFFLSWVARDTVFCFDDLERVKPEQLLDLLGTIQSLLVEQRKSKVLFIGNEDRIKGDAKYTEAKEKYILRTIHFFPDIVEFLKSYEKHIPTNELRFKDFLSGKLELIANLSQDAKLENIRTLQFFLEACRVLLNSGPTAMEYFSQIEHIKSLFFICIMYKNADIQDMGDFKKLSSKVFTFNWEKATNRAKDEEFLREKELIELYGYDVFGRQLPEIIERVVINGDALSNDIENEMKILTGKNIASHLKAWAELESHWNAKEENLSSQIRIVLRAARKGLYPPLLYLRIAEWMEGFRKSEILKSDYFKRFIKKGLNLALNSYSEPVTHSPDYFLNSDRYSGGKSEFSEGLKEMIRSTYEQGYSSWQKESARELLKHFSSESPEFRDAYMRFTNIPLFSKDTVDIYVEFAPGMKAPDMSRFMSIIRDKYLRTSNANEFYNEAVPFIKQFKSAVEIEIAKSTKFRKHKLNELNLVLQEAIDHLKLPE